MTGQQLEALVRLVDVMRQSTQQVVGVVTLRAPQGQSEFRTGSLAELSPNDLGAKLQELGIDPAQITCPEDLFVDEYDLQVAHASWKRITHT